MKVFGIISSFIAYACWFYLGAHGLTLIGPENTTDINLYLGIGGVILTFLSGIFLGHGIIQIFDAVDSKTEG